MTDHFSDVRTLGYALDEMVPAVMSAMRYSHEEVSGRKCRMLVSETGDKVEILYNKSRKPKSLLVEDALWSIVEPMLREDAQRQSQKVACSVLFSYKPIAGYFRVDDWIQLRPVSLSLRDSSGADLLATKMGGGVPYPFVFEVKYRDSMLDFLEAERRMRAVDEAAWLLAVFLDVPIFRLQLSLVWTFYQLEYHLMSAGMGTGFAESILADFSDVSGLQSMETKSIDEYYHRAGIGETQLQVPNLTELHNRYIGLEVQTKSQWLRVGAAILDANNPANSISQRVVGLVSSIEPLIDVPSRCPSCKGYIGISKAFGAFLDTYVKPSDKTREYYMDIYDARSRVVHGGWRFDVDEHFWDHSDMVTVLPTAAWHATKVGAMNWFLDPMRCSVPKAG